MAIAQSVRNLAGIATMATLPFTPASKLNAAEQLDAAARERQTGIHAEVSPKISDPYKYLVAAVEKGPVYMPHVSAPRLPRRRGPDAAEQTEADRRDFYRANPEKVVLLINQSYLRGDTNFAKETAQIALDLKLEPKEVFEALSKDDNPAAQAHRIFEGMKLTPEASKEEQIAKCEELFGLLMQAQKQCLDLGQNQFITFSRAFADGITMTIGADAAEPILQPMHDAISRILGRQNPGGVVPPIPQRSGPAAPKSPNSL